MSVLGEYAVLLTFIPVAVATASVNMMLLSIDRIGIAEGKVRALDPKDPLHHQRDRGFNAIVTLRVDTHVFNTHPSAGELHRSIFPLWGRLGGWNFGIQCHEGPA